MIDQAAVITAMQKHGLERWAERIPEQLEKALESKPHGDMQRWQQALDNLPRITADEICLNQPVVSAFSETPQDTDTIEQLTEYLKQLHPWRKGPFNLHGVHIDTEWRSDWKWERVSPHLSDLKDRAILDVGCGNGYHCWRMAGAGARLVIGIDPTQLFLAQFNAIKRYLGDQFPVHFLPLGIEQVPENLRAFDTVLSMGVLYHRRSPIDHLYELKGCLRTGGELVLETLVIDGPPSSVLVPTGRYAKMRNVWFLPTPETLIGWMQRCGFRDVQLADVTVTTTEEQRSTEWMQFESLADFLDPQDSSKTIEGYPAPKRATIVATSS